MKNFWDNLKEVLINLFHSFWAWWVEIVTRTPAAHYLVLSKRQEANVPLRLGI